MASGPSRPVLRTAGRRDVVQGRLEVPGDHLRSILARMGLLRPNIVFLGVLVAVFAVITALLSSRSSPVRDPELITWSPALGLRPAAPLEIALLGGLLGQVLSAGN